MVLKSTRAIISERHCHQHLLVYGPDKIRDDKDHWLIAMKTWGGRFVTRNRKRRQIKYGKFQNLTLSLLCNEHKFETEQKSRV